MSLPSEKIETAFKQCVDLTGEARSRCIAGICGSDAKLAREVEALLRADEENRDNDGFLEWSKPKIGEVLVRPGTSVDGFKVVRRIGSGACGEVYLATGDEDQCVAIKFLWPWLHSSRNRIRFRQEAEALAQFRHENVARLIQTGTFQELPYLVTDFVDGLPLDQKLDTENADSDRIPLKERVAWVESACRGVSAVHEHQLLHRDIKPSNILIREDGTSVVTDFGVAKYLGDLSARQLTMTGEVVGTPKYMAPEQTRKAGQLVWATDVYALGAVLFFVLTGQPPVHGKSIVDIIDEIRMGAIPNPAELNPNVDTVLSTICMKCLQKEPTARYRTADELADDLSNWIAGRPIKARKVSTFQRVNYWVRRNPAFGLLTACLALILVIGAVMVAVLWSQAEANFRSAKASEQVALDRNRALNEMLADLTELARQTADSNEDLRLRRLVLEAMAKGYEKMDLSDPDLKRKSAIVWLLLGRLELDMAEREKALVSMDRAKVRFRELAASHPSDTKYLYDVFHCLREQNLKIEALKTMQDLVELEPNNLYYQDALSDSHLGLARRLIPTNPQQTLWHCEIGMEISRRVLETCDEKDRCMFRKKLGMHRLARGKAKLVLGEIDEAAIDLKTAINHYEACLVGLPNDQVIMLHQVYAMLTLSSLQFNSGNDAEAIKLAIHAEIISSQFSELFPSLAIALETRFNALRHNAYLAFASGDVDLQEKWRAELNASVDSWIESGINRDQALRARAEFRSDFKFNRSVDLAAVGSLPVDTDYSFCLSRIRAGLAQKNFEVVEAEYDRSLELWQNYYRGYFEVARMLSEGKPIDFDQVTVPNQLLRFHAIGCGEVLSNVMAQEHLKEELAAIAASSMQDVAK